MGTSRWASWWFDGSEERWSVDALTWEERLKLGADRARDGWVYFIPLPQHRQARLLLPTAPIHTLPEAADSWENMPWSAERSQTLPCSTAPSDVGGQFHPSANSTGVRWPGV